MEINQYSRKGEPINIELRSGYVVLIDAGFYYPFKNNTNLTPKENIIEHMKINFEYAGLDLIGIIQLDNFKVDKYSLSVSEIKKKYHEINKEPVLDDGKGYFGIDTGELLIIDYQDFELFTETAHDGIFENSFDYKKPIEKLNAIIGHKSFAIIESPGCGKGYDFEGDGSYFIDKSAFKQFED